MVTASTIHEYDGISYLALVQKCQENSLTKVWNLNSDYS